ncbi:MAG: DUF3300 domain-containing protein [Syntrophobacteraceae bacterium]|nr:DUF3300 domain-containing protein [Syntrophobacteraceae bacterium]
MKISRFLGRSLIVLLAMMMVPFGAFSQEAPSSAKAFTEAELDQMLAPIALYPDSLLAQIMVAATFPDQVAEADAWLKANPNLKGDALNAALDKMNWDLSVKALAPFPQVLAMMAARTAWTKNLGDAFTAQESDVIAAVQKLRSKAYAAGNLKTTAEQKVVVRNNTYEVEPVNPDVVYVPRYDPSVVYGSWWWPAYPPFAYYPVWPGVAMGVGVFGFWGGISVGPSWGWGWGSWNWGGRHMNVNVNRNININSRNAHINRNFRTANFHSFAGRGTAGRRGAGFGHNGACGAQGRPSAASFQRGLKAGGSRGAAGNVSHRATRGTGSSRSGKVSRAGSRSAGARRGTANVRHGKAHGTGRHATGHVNRGGSRGAGHRTNMSRGGARGAGHHGGGGGGGKGRGRK